MESRWIWPFELLDKLGEGGMGVVYRARYVGNDRMVAVKLVPDEIANNPTLLARFERELDVLKQLRHPHIVHCFGGVCESKQRFYAMELVEGGTLHSLLREVGKLPWETVVDYGLQMCSALQCAHEQNVVHRDVKPGNFLMTRAGKLKLSDFGLAIVVASQRITSAGKTMGTFHYMAPEQIRGKPPVTNRTDLYALGCVLYEMLTGAPPFDAESAAEVLHKHLKESPPRVRDLEPQCPIELDALIDELLQKNPEARPATANQVAARLKAVSAPPSTTISSMALTPIVSRDVVDVRSEPVLPASVQASAPPNGWLVLTLALALVWMGASQWQAHQWKQRAAQAEAATIFMFEHGNPELKLAAIQTLGRMNGLQPVAQNFLLEQLQSPNSQIRLATVQLCVEHPEMARLARGTLTKLDREDADPEVRRQLKLALDASHKAHSAGPFWKTLFGWIVPLSILGMLFLLARSAWQWAKSHALIPGL